MYHYINIADRKFLKANENNILNGRLNMKQHRIVNLDDLVDSCDAVNLRYVSSRIQALADENTKLSDNTQRLILTSWQTT